MRSAQLAAAWRMVRYVPAAAGACAAGLRCRCCTCSYFQAAGRRGRRCSGALLQQAPSSAADLVPRRARNYVAIREGLTTTWCACALRPVPSVVCDTAGVTRGTCPLDVPLHHCCTCPPPPCALHSSTGTLPPRARAGMVPKACGAPHKQPAALVHRAGRAQGEHVRRVHQHLRLGRQDCDAGGRHGDPCGPQARPRSRCGGVAGLSGRRRIECAPLCQRSEPSDVTKSGC